MRTGDPFEVVAEASMELTPEQERVVVLVGEDYLARDISRRLLDKVPGLILQYIDEGEVYHVEPGRGLFISSEEELARHDSDLAKAMMAKVEHATPYGSLAKRKRKRERQARLRAAGRKAFKAP